MYDEKTPSTQLTYNIGDILAITIAPDDKVQQFLSKTRVQDFHEYYSKKFEHFKPQHFNHWFRIEISEPIGEISNQGPRLHLHGVIELKTKYSVFTFLLTIMPDLLQHARLEIHHLKDDKQHIGWIRYCKKQQDLLPVNFCLTNYTDIHDNDITRPKGNIE